MTGATAYPLPTKRATMPQERTNRVEYATYAGIDVFPDEDNTEPVITMALLDDGTNPVLNVRVYGRADINPETARNLANALNRFADQHSPRDQSIGIRLHGVEYPQANRIVTVTDKAAQGDIAKRHSIPGYVGLDGKVHHDVHPVSASVWPEWVRD